VFKAVPVALAHERDRSRCALASQRGKRRFSNADVERARLLRQFFCGRVTRTLPSPAPSGGCALFFTLTQCFDRPP
jgi:hypothetical protein